MMRNLVILVSIISICAWGCSGDGKFKKTQTAAPIQTQQQEIAKEIGRGLELLKGDRIVARDVFADNLVCSVKMDKSGVQRDIFILKKDGSGLKQLTRSRGYNASPKWLWDGKYIGFYSSPTELSILSKEGQNLKKITFANRSYCEIFLDKVVFFQAGKFYLMDEKLKPRQIAQISRKQYDLKGVFFRTEGIYFKISFKGRLGFGEAAECFIIDYRGNMKQIDNNKFQSKVFS